MTTHEREWRDPVSELCERVPGSKSFPHVLNADTKHSCLYTYTIPYFKTLSLFFIKEFASKTVGSLPADRAGDRAKASIVIERYNNYHS